MFAFVVYISLGARSTYPDLLTLLPESTFARTPFFAPPSSLFARGLTLPIDHLLHIPDRRTTAGNATYYADPTIPSPALPDYPSPSGSLAFPPFRSLICFSYASLLFHSLFPFIIIN